MSLEKKVGAIVKGAYQASAGMAAAETAVKNLALEKLADLLRLREQEIIQANRLDLEEADKKGLDAARKERLKITPAGVASMA
ncbi:MAG: gamma-glutamyl-phosphate reductase, partial [Desulfonatronovibrionaceae bacterium]